MTRKEYIELLDYLEKIEKKIDAFIEEVNELKQNVFKSHAN